MGKVNEYFSSVCPECGSPAYLGMNDVECSSALCRNGSAKYRELYIKLALEDYLRSKRGAAEVDPLEDEDTDPQMSFPFPGHDKP